MRFGYAFPLSLLLLYLFLHAKTEVHNSFLLELEADASQLQGGSSETKQPRDFYEVQIPVSPNILTHIYGIYSFTIKAVLVYSTIRRHECR